MAAVRKFSAKVYADLAYLAKVKTGAARRLSVQNVKPVGRCTVNGEPLKASHKIRPVSGSVRDGHPRKGTCPECGTPVRISDKGFVTSHIVRNEPMGTNPALSSVSVEPTDTGPRVGDPDAGDRRRNAEIDGAFKRGTVDVKVVGADGKARVEARPATEENLRLAVEQTRQRADGKRKRADEARITGDVDKALGCAQAASRLNAEASALMRQVRGAMAGQDALHADHAGAAIGQRGHGRSDGAALAGANMPPVQPRKGWLAKAGTTDLPVGRVRPDLGALGAQMSTHDPKRVKACADMDCRHLVGGHVHGTMEFRVFKGLSRSQQRKVWGRVRKAKQRAQAAREKSRQLEVLGSPFGTKHLADDSMARTESLMQEKRAVAKV